MRGLNLRSPVQQKSTLFPEGRRMSSDTPTSLLSLTGTVEELLLSFVSAGEGGVHAVLNLRETCSTTKLWVDTLRPTQSRRIFSSRKATVGLSVERLEKFLAAPPPSGQSGLTGVTSLCLKEMDGLSDHRFPPQREEVWSRFVSYWSPKLEFLEVDVLFLPLNLKLDPLLSLESLRSLRCDTIKYNVGKSDGLPESLFRFEELSIGRLEMGISQTQEFFSRLSTQQNLKRLSLKIDKISVLSEVVGLIERKTAAEDFKLSLTVDVYNFHEFDGPEWDRLKALYVRLATSVANSSASIRIRGLREVELCRFIREELDQETTRKFFKSIVGMTGHLVTSYAFDWNLRATDFPNLETFTLTSEFVDDEYLETLEATAFSPTLKKLQVVSGFPRPASLPSTLTHLDIMKYFCSANELLQVLFSLAAECPSLRNLKLEWDYSDWEQVEDYSSYDFRSFATSPKFKDLRSLVFCADLLAESEVAVCQMIFLHGFKLPQLNLLDLKLEFDGPFPVVNHNILVAFNSGAISESLLNVDVEPGYVVKDAIPLLDVLKSTAAENKRKRVETHGKERERQFDR